MTTDELLNRGALPLRYQISSLCANANKCLPLARIIFGSSNPVGIATGFKALVRPILKCLEYACPVWNPYLVKHILAVQMKASRLICGPEKAFAERLAELNCL